MTTINLDLYDVNANHYQCNRPKAFDVLVRKYIVFTILNGIFKWYALH